MAIVYSYDGVVWGTPYLILQRTFLLWPAFLRLQRSLQLMLEPLDESLIPTGRSSPLMTTDLLEPPLLIFSVATTATLGDRVGNTGRDAAGYSGHGQSYQFQ